MKFKTPSEGNQSQKMDMSPRSWNSIGWNFPEIEDQNYCLLFAG